MKEGGNECEQEKEGKIFPAPKQTKFFFAEGVKEDRQNNAALKKNRDEGSVASTIEEGSCDTGSRSDRRKSNIDEDP